MKTYLIAKKDLNKAGDNETHNFMVLSNGDKENVETKLTNGSNIVYYKTGKNLETWSETK